MQIHKANLIPKSYLQQLHYSHFGQKVSRILTITILLLVLFTSMIFGICYYIETNRDMDVPESIKNEYVLAQKNSELLKKKQEILTLAKSEDTLVIETLSALLSAKPNDIRLTKFEITNNNVIQIDGFANDPASFNQYVSQINVQSTLFSKAVVERIAGTNGTAKTFTIKAERKAK